MEPEGRGSTPLSQTMKKISSVKRGNICKAKTKKWFLEHGYETEYPEKVQYFKKSPSSPMIFIKRDLFGADGVSMNGKDIIFWNSKSVSDAVLEPVKIEAIARETARDFAKHQFPIIPGVILQAVIWAPRKKPVFVDVTEKVMNSQLCTKEKETV